MVWFAGTLERHPADAFEIQDIRSLLRDLESMPYRLQLQFRLDNWTLERRDGAWRIAPVDADLTIDDPAEGFIASAMLHARLSESQTLDDDF